MKYIIFVPDGMADEPIEELGGKTCLEAAVTRNMDMIARRGIVGTVNNVPKGMVPASDVANMAILGYDPKKYYCGRGPLEAANLGVSLGEKDVAFRFNTVTVSEGIMADYSAGHISTNETDCLVKVLNEKMASERFTFHTGTSYRNLMVMHCDSIEEANKFAKVHCTPPHDILDHPIEKHMPRDNELKDVMERSCAVLKDVDVNKVRIDLGQNPANMIWLWGQGKTPDVPKFRDAFGIDGGIISAVDLVKGIGKILGLEVVNVPGATGYYDTNYEGKADAALKVLEEKDLAFVHVEAVDEAGHNGDMKEKIRAIENFDSKIIGRMLAKLDGKVDYRVMVLPDHPTPVKRRTHTMDAVPFALAGKGIEADEGVVYTEKAAKAGSVHIKKGYELIKELLAK